MGTDAAGAAVHRNRGRRRGGTGVGFGTIPPMTDPATGQRSFLQALKVPFDLRGVGLGAVAFLVLMLGARAIAPNAGPWYFLERGGSAFERTLRGWSISRDEALGLLGLHLAVAAVFGVACCRIAGMRLARDEGVAAGPALGFSIGNLGSTLGAYLFMFAAAALFYAANAAAGLLAGVPGVGPFTMWVLFPLVLLSSLVMFLLIFGSVLGLPLVLASLAVERNGALDAVSRAFSYVFSRPALFFAYGITIYLLAIVLSASALAIEGLAAWSFTHWFPDGESWAEVRRAVHAAGTAVIEIRGPEFGGVRGAAVAGGWAAWIFGMGFHLALMGWVVYYAFGGGAAAYFALRRDVDGTEDEEIWVEGEEDRFGEPERPVPPPPSDAAGATPAGPGKPSS